MIDFFLGISECDKSKDLYSTYSKQVSVCWKCLDSWVFLMTISVIVCKSLNKLIF